MGKSGLAVDRLKGPWRQDGAERGLVIGADFGFFREVVVGQGCPVGK